LFQYYVFIFPTVHFPLIRSSSSAA